MFDGDNNVFHLALIQLGAAVFHPLVHLVFLLSKTRLGDISVMLAGVVQIDDLSGSKKMFVRNIPYPERAVSEHGNVLCPVHASPLRLLIEPPAEGLRCLNRSGITGGRFIPDRAPFFVHSRLGENAPQFDLSCFCLAVFSFALPALGFFLDHRHSRSVHADIHPGNRLYRNNIGSQSGFALRGLILRHLLADPLGNSFDLLGGHSDSSQFVQVFMAGVERAVGAYLAHHPAHTGAVRGSFDIQRPILRTKAAFTFLVGIVRARHRHGTENRQQGLGPIPLELAGVSLFTRNGRTSVIASIGIDQLFQHGAADPVHGRANAQLEGLQVGTAGGSPFFFITGDKTAYFFLDFTVDRIRDFFLSAAASPSPSVSRRGRASQIRSFSSIISSQSARKIRWFAVSFKYFLSSGPSLRFFAWLFPLIVAFHKCCGP